jgi:hypothetical protein
MVFNGLCCLYAVRCTFKKGKHPLPSAISNNNLLPVSLYSLGSAAYTQAHCGLDLLGLSSPPIYKYTLASAEAGSTASAAAGVTGAAAVADMAAAFAVAPTADAADTAA